MKGAAQATAKVRLAHVTTGDVIEAWPVDAREHLAAGDFVNEADWVAPDVSAPAESAKKGK